MSGGSSAFGSGSAFAFVHSLDAAERDGVALLDEFCAENLSSWHSLRPWVVIA